jgi:hypothetical protein
VFVSADHASAPTSTTSGGHQQRARKAADARLRIQRPSIEQFLPRSDHYSYAAKGIPIAFFFTGTHPYHGVGDHPSKILYPSSRRLPKWSIKLVSTRQLRPDTHQGQQGATRGPGVQRQDRQVIHLFGPCRARRRDGLGVPFPCFSAKIRV